MNEPDTRFLSPLAFLKIAPVLLSIYLTAPVCEAVHVWPLSNRTSRNRKQTTGELLSVTENILASLLALAVTICRTSWVCVNRCAKPALQPHGSYYGQQQPSRSKGPSNCLPCIFCFDGEAGCWMPQALISKVRKEKGGGTWKRISNLQIQC